MPQSNCTCRRTRTRSLRSAPRAPTGRGVPFVRSYRERSCSWRGCSFASVGEIVRVTLSGRGGAGRCSLQTRLLKLLTRRSLGHTNMTASWRLTWRESRFWLTRGWLSLLNRCGKPRGLQGGRMPLLCSGIGQRISLGGCREIIPQSSGPAAADAELVMTCRTAARAYWRGGFLQ
jgi:hypothetical protein